MHADFRSDALLVRIERLRQRAGPAGASAAARHDLEEIPRQFAHTVKLEHLYRFWGQSVDELDIRLEAAFRQLRMRFELLENRICDAAALRKVPRRRSGGTRDRPLFLCENVDVHRGKDGSEFLEGHHPVHLFGMESHFVTFRDAGTDENDLRVRVRFAGDVRGIKHRAGRGGNHRQERRRVLLRRLDIGRAARGSHKSLSRNHFLLKFLCLMLSRLFRTERHLDHIFEADLRHGGEELPDRAGELILRGRRNDRDDFLTFADFIENIQQFGALHDRRERAVGEVWLDECNL